MTSASLPAKRGPKVTAESRDRWDMPSGRVGRFSLGMAIVLLGSLLLHAIILATAILDGSRAKMAPEQEIAVEVIQEKPADPPKDTPKAAPLAKAEDAKSEAAKPETLKAEAVKTEAAKPDAAKPEPPPLKPSLADAKPPSPPPSAPPPDDKVAALEKEFAALKAERAALEARQAEAANAAAAPVGPVDAGMGPLPDSFQAVALPATGGGADEAIDYRELVFSQLAKAKGLGETKGLPGTAGVHFTIDDTGQIASLEIVHPSGIPTLDAEALAIVRKAAPFPSPPQGAQRSFDANVNFVVEGQR